MTRSTFLLLDDLDDCCNFTHVPIKLFCGWFTLLACEVAASFCHLFFVVYLSEFIDLFIHLLTYMFIHHHLPTLPKSHPSVHPSSIRPSIHLFVYLYSHSHRTLLVNSCNIHATLLVKSRHSMVKSEGIPPPSQGSSSICAACSGFNSPDRVGSYLGCKPRWEKWKKDILEATKRTTSRCILECIYYL